MNTLPGDGCTIAGIDLPHVVLQRLEGAPQLPDALTLEEPGVDWIDGGCRGVAARKSALQAVRRQVSDRMHALDRDADMRKKTIDGGFEVVDVP